MDKFSLKIRFFTFISHSVLTTFAGIPLRKTLFVEGAMHPRSACHEGLRAPGCACSAPQ